MVTTTDRLPTPDLLDGDCVHDRFRDRIRESDDAPLAAFTYADSLLLAFECDDCIRLALSRARDEGIEAAAQFVYGTVVELVDDIRALKEDRQR